MMRALAVTSALLLSAAALAEAPRSIHAWADVSIAVDGALDDVKLVVPPLSPAMAEPIENTIRSWSFAPGLENGVPVRRTTSVALVIQLVTTPDGGKTIEAEKLAEGPRILRRANIRCLEEVNGAAVPLSFTVTSEGRVVDISGSDPDDVRQQCAITVMRDTIFKPESVNGQNVSSQVNMTFEFK